MKVTVEDGSGKVTIEPGTAKGAATWDGASMTGVIVKAEMSRRFTLHVAYPALKADVAVAADGRRDFASPGAVEDAAWAYLRKHRQVGLHHADDTEGAAEVVESYVYRGPDWVVKAANGTEHTIKSGDWLTGLIWSEKVWPDVLAGKIGGVSMQGTARRGVPTQEALAALR